jgi:hypothetical protein
MDKTYLNKEIELLLACARARVDAGRATQIRQLVEGDIDWDYLVKAASHHGLVPLLFYNLRKSCPEAMPRSVSSDLQKRYIINARHNILLTREPRRILDLFEANGIAAISFKGLALAQQINRKS